VGRIDVVMIVMSLVVNMECLVVSFCLCIYYVGRPWIWTFFICMER
jgi:hypothetical protein